MSGSNVHQMADYQQRYEDAVRRPLATGGGDDNPPSMDARVTILEHLAAQTKAELHDARADMRDMRAEMKAGRTEDRTRHLTLMVTVITTGLAVAGVLFTLQSNMLSAFQAGLSAVQAVARGGGQPPPQPIVIQLPPAQQPQPTATRPPGQ